ncbi:hypothetical protein [Marinomonas sp. TI.3.20]|uniref:hypothetical protein n=1 Tax=Marinomonas sp. TI.3.20 TaxID=3121296 RepID=UPI0040534955
MPHLQPHRQNRVGWLRAAVLGANDGIVSTSSLISRAARQQTPHLAILGAISTYLSGAKMVIGIARVSFWGALAMSVTALVGFAFDAAMS